MFSRGPADKRQHASESGDQTDGQTGFFLRPSYYRRMCLALRSRAISFLETPDREPYGQLRVFVHGGAKWNLLRLNAPTATTSEFRS